MARYLCVFEPFSIRSETCIVTRAPFAHTCLRVFRFDSMSIMKKKPLLSSVGERD